MRRINSNSCIVDPAALQKSSSRLESHFLRLWQALGGPPLDQEAKVAEGRRWRFDFCHAPSLTAIEIEGGTWSKGRHNRGSGYQADCEKYNAAALLGFSIFRLTGDMISTPHIQPIIERCKNFLN